LERVQFSSGQQSKAPDAGPSKIAEPSGGDILDARAASKLKVAVTG